MRAVAMHGDELRLCLVDVDEPVRGAVEALGFGRSGAFWLRTFAGDAPHAAAAGARFERCAEPMVCQAAGFEPAPWEETLETLLARAAGVDWWLAGSAALAARGLEVSPRDVDVIASAESCAELAERLADLLVEPLGDGGFLGARWFRAFARARIEGVGDVHASVDEPTASDFGPAAAARLETIVWRGHELRVPPLELQLAATERRGLTERAALIRAALA